MNKKDELEEIMEELNDPEIKEALAKSQKEFEHGEVGNEKDIFKLLGTGKQNKTTDTPSEEI